MPITSAVKFLFLRGRSWDLSALPAFAAVAVVVILAGGLIRAVLPAGASDWLAAASYLAPAGVAFAVHWWMSQGR